jgi:hypothetical protein
MYDGCDVELRLMNIGTQCGVPRGHQKERKRIVTRD